MVIFFILLFAYTKLAGPIPFYVNSVSTQKNTTFDVTGEGSVSVKPDQVRLNAGISANTQTVKAAQDQINITINKVSSAVKNLGVDSSDIRTENYNINPTYDYSAVPQRITGYQASTNLSIKVKKIENINSVIDAVTAAGANQVGGVIFEVSDKAKFEAQVRENAVAQAKQRAQNAAKAGGFSLGRLVNYSESFQGSPVPPRLMAVGVPAAKDNATRVEAGSSEIKVSVTLSYEIR